MNKIRRDEPSGVIIHMYMEISQGISLCTYLYLKLKHHVFHVIFSLFFLPNWRTVEQNKFCPLGRAGSSGRGDVRERVGG
jgi:hypothetical protein